MQNIVLNIMNQYGYFGIFFLIVVENIFPPIPSEVILVFGGVLTTYTRLTPFWVIFYSTLGSLVGAYFLYILGALVNKERLKKIVEGKVGRVLRLKSEDIEKADCWFQKRGYKAVFYCRFIPIVRSLISVPAGISEMPILKFSIYTVIGTIIWNTVLVTLGSLVGENWKVIVAFFKEFSFIVRLILIFSIFYFIYKVFWKRKKNG